MIPPKIKEAVEKSLMVSRSLEFQRYGNNWSVFTRTVFEKIAHWINIEVTRKVIESPFLVNEFFMFGEDEFNSILFKNDLTDSADFIRYLKDLHPQRPHHWISGKTLQLYWNNGNAKDKKLNVLLTFLGVEINEWDEWKRSQLAIPSQSSDLLTKLKKGSTINLLKKYYLGHYYRYYQKTDNSPVLIKTPLVIREDPKEFVVVETKTTGHWYLSSSILIRGGALYIDCENLDWDEKESYVFNIGLETNPQLLVGVSSTMSKRRRGLGIKNVLVRQQEPFNYFNTEAKEIPFNSSDHCSCEESAILEFFKQSTDNLILTPYCNNLDELKALTSKQVPIDRY